jgi:hypothetical protein
MSSIDKHLADVIAAENEAMKRARRRGDLNRLRVNCMRDALVEYLAWIEQRISKLEESR